MLRLDLEAHTQGTRPTRLYGGVMLTKVPHITCSPGPQTLASRQPSLLCLQISLFSQFPQAPPGGGATTHPGARWSGTLSDPLLMGCSLPWAVQELRLGICWGILGRPPSGTLLVWGVCRLTEMTWVSSLL